MNGRTAPLNDDVGCAFQMKDMNHENLNQFIGLCTEAPNISIATVNCTRRSLMVMLRYRTAEITGSLF